MSGITPGKWLSDDQGYVFKDDKLGTTIFVPGEGIPCVERPANAKAAVALPELIAALKETREVALAMVRLIAVETDEDTCTMITERLSKFDGFGVRAADALRKAGVEL